MPDLIQLDDKRLKQLDGNIKQMVSSGASQDDVMKYAFDFKNQFGLKKKDGGEISFPTELPSVSREYLDKGQELADASFLKKIGEPDRSQLVSQYKSPDISLTQKPKKDYYSTKLEKGLIFDKEGQLYAPSSEALSKDITAAEQASLKKSTQKDLVEKSREMPVEPVKEPTEEQGLLLNLVSSLDRGFAKNFISNPMKGLGTFLQGTTKKVLGGSGEGDLSNFLIKYGDYLNNAIEELTPQDQEYKDSLWDQAAQALGQVGSLILTGGLTGASGKAAALVAQAPKGAVATAASRIGSQLSAPTSISAGLSMGQAEFDRAIQAGATDDQAFEVFYKNAVTGSVLETIPVMQFFKRFNKSTAGGLVNYLKTKGVAGFTGGVEEMTTEILQQVYANKTAKDIYNINQSILDGVGSSGGIGFGVGFLLNAMGANARILRKQGKEQDAVAIENQIEQYENNLKNPKVTSGNTAKDIVTQGVEIGTQKAVQDLDRDLANNVITPEKYQEGIAFAEKAAQVVDKIPETVTGESKVKSVELLVERNDIKQANQNLLQQKQATDEAYHAGIDEEIKANEEKIKEIDGKVYDIAKKPSKEFGTKRYEIDGEEVSKEAFEALTGKPIGTKEIIAAEVKPVETYEDKVKQILINQSKAEGYRYMGAASDLAKIPIEDIQSNINDAIKEYKWKDITTDDLPIKTVYRLKAEFEAKGYGDIPDGTKIESIKDKIDSLEPSKGRLLEDDIYKRRKEELDSLSYLPMTIKDDMTPADKKKVQDRREDIKKINAKYDAELAELEKVKPTEVEVTEKVKPTEVKVASTEFFNRPVNGKIYKTNKTSAESNWGIKSVNGEYIVDEVVGNTQDIIKRPESLVKPLFDEANVSSPDDKIFVTKPAKLRKNEDGTFDVVEKGEIYYGKEAPKTEVKPTEVKEEITLEEEPTQSDIAKQQTIETDLLIGGQAAQRRKDNKYTKDGVEYIRNSKGNGVPSSVTGDVRFTNEVSLPFKYKLIEAKDLQPSHQDGMRNPNHFIPEAQPKNRNDAGSLMAENSFSSKPRFEELGENTNAYSGAPIVNERGEVVQGNNRAAGLRKGYDAKNKQYKNDLANNSSQFGFTKEQVEKMNEPILVREVAVSDEGAIEVGNYDVKDLETGGKRRLDPIAITRRMPFDIKGRIAEMLFTGEETLNQAIRANQKRVLELLNPYLNQAQRNTITKEGVLTDAGIKDLEDVVKQFLFDNGDTALPDLFENLSANQKEGLKKSLPYIFSTSPDKSIVPDIQEAILAVADFRDSGAGDFNAWLAQGDMFADGKTPRDKYTPLEIEIAKTLIEAKTQKEIVKKFGDYSDIVKDKEANMFDPAIAGKTRAEGIKEIFKTEDYAKPISERGGKTPVRKEELAAEPSPKPRDAKKEKIAREKAPEKSIEEAYKDLTINQKRQINNSKFDKLLKELKIEKICPT
jgi:hypothetical protein